MASLPNRGDLDGSHTDTKGAFKAAIDLFYNFLSAWLGTDSSDKKAGHKALKVVDPGTLRNFNFVFSFTGSVLTAALKDQDSNDPTSDSPVLLAQRNSNPALGLCNLRSVEAALSMAFSNGCTFGLSSSSSAPIYLYLMDNGGTQEIAASAKFYGASGIFATTTAMSGGATDPAKVYSTVGRASLPFRAAARIKAPQATAGAWAANPSSVELWPWVDATADVANSVPDFLLTARGFI